MILPLAILAVLSTAAVLVLGLSVLPWVSELAATVSTMAVRPRLSPVIAVLAAALFVVFYLGLAAVARRLMPGLAAALTAWLIPFIAVRILNQAARWRDRSRDLPPPLPLAGTTTRLDTYIFDVERARLVAQYEPPPII